MRDMNYCAIDFETATSSRNSACSVAVTDVVNGVVKDSYYTLIKPPNNYYDWRNVEIHGIHEEDTINAPTFAEIWPELKEHLEGKIVLAHNASFDMSVLKYCLNDFSLGTVNLQKACTVKIARAAWPHLSCHKLNVVAEYMNIQFKHHDALEDARTCAYIPLVAAKELGVTSLPELLKRLGVSCTKFTC